MIIRKIIFGGICFGAFSMQVEAHYFGDFKRTAVASRSSPWAAVGKVARTGCTGTIIHDRMAITTAKCVLDSDTKRIRQGVDFFYANVVDGQEKVKTEIVRIKFGTLDPNANESANWAILILGEPIGRQTGNFGVNKAVPDSIEIAGYEPHWNSGNTLSVSFGCSVRKMLDNGNFYHDCPYGSAAGSPVFVSVGVGLATLVGVTTGHFKCNTQDFHTRWLSKYYDDCAAYAVSAKQFSDSFKQLMSSID